MQLTRYTDLSLRVLILLATIAPESLTIAEIAKRLDISRNHLMKVVQGLSQDGFIEARRGAGGGNRLAVAAEKLTVGQVVRATENNLQLVNCYEPACPIAGVCRLEGVLDEAREAFLKVLDGYTLRDLSKNRDTLVRLAAL